MSALAAALLAGAYLLGAVPFGLLLTRRMLGLDVRSHGSGNIGATNVARTAGKKLGVVVLVLDALKALVPALLARWLFPAQPAVHALAGGAAVLGHVFPIYLKLRGGKGVASALGALLALTPAAALGGAALFAVVFAITRIVSIGSLFGALAAVALAFALPYPRPYALLALGLTLLIFVRHRGNVRRLWRRTERRL